MTDGIRDALGMDSKNRENRDGETVVEASELRALRQQLHQERERAEQYAGILRNLVEAQDEIDVEAEKPLHQRSTAPMVKKIEAIKEARRVLGGE